VVSAARPSAIGIKNSAAATSDSARNLLRVGKVLSFFLFPQFRATYFNWLAPGNRRKLPRAGHCPLNGEVRVNAMIFPSYHPEESAKRPDRLRGAKKVVDNFVERA